MKRLVAILLLLALASCQTPYADAPAYLPASLGGDPAAREATRPGSGDRPPAAEPEPSAVLSLEECINLALRRSRRAWIAERRALIARDRTDEALSQILPKLTLEAHYDWRNNDRGVSFQGANLVTGDRSGVAVRAGLIVPIYDFGRASWTQEAESRRAERAVSEAEQGRHELSLAVRQTYYRFLEARKIRDVVLESIRVVERQLEVSRDFLAQGLVARSDVLSSELQQAERRQELILAGNNIELARATLNRLLGFDVNRATEIRDVLEVAPWTGRLEKVMKLAVDRRADLGTLRRQIEINRAEYEVVKRGNLPLLYGTAEYDYQSDSLLLNKQWFAAGAGIQIPIFDGLSTQAQMRRKTKEIAEAIDLHDERVDEALLEVKQAWLSVGESSERLPVARKATALAEENLRVIRDQYAEGIVSSTDVLYEEDRLSRARSGYVRALYDVHAAIARLQYAIGGPLPEKE